MGIENITKYSKEVNNAFQKVHYKRKVLPFQFWFSVIMIASAGLCFALGDSVAGIEILVVIILFNLFLCMIYALSKNRVDKSYILMQEEPTNTYSFFENEMKIDSASKSSSSTATYSYNLINSVLVNKRLTVIYINKISAFLVDNNGFTSGSVEELADLLKEKVGCKKVKIKNCSKKTDA